jgi:phosphoribosylanthranilate isomerase
MTWIKICGITNLEDALTAVNAGADALGFVFYEKSPRKIDPEAAREIVGQLPPQVEKVGVFVNDAAERIDDIASSVGLTAVQFYGEEGVNNRDTARDLSARLACNFFFVVPVSRLSGKQERLGRFAPRTDRPKLADAIFVDAIFVDSGTAQQPGGTGKNFGWKENATAVSTLVQDVNVVIAGGLTPTNVTEAIRILKPWGVDVASGVEARPGKKDPEKICAFVAAVRSAEKNR